MFKFGDLLKSTATGVSPAKCRAAAAVLAAYGFIPGGPVAIPRPRIATDPFSGHRVAARPTPSRET